MKDHHNRAKKLVASQPTGTLAGGPSDNWRQFSIAIGELVGELLARQLKDRSKDSASS